MFDDTFISLSPINFFQISVDCHPLKDSLPFPQLQNLPKKYLLPDTSSLCAEDSFAQIAMGWSRLGLEFCVDSSESFYQASYPAVARGDSVEIFIDTRDVKTSGFNTRFCHHFFFLPESVEGQVAGEITHFRTEDSHELCDSNLLKVECTLKKNSYSMNIFIPMQCLHGYDPDQFDRLGFTYRINRKHGAPQHFSVTSTEYQLTEQPSLWTSVRLVK